MQANTNTHPWETLSSEIGLKFTSWIFNVLGTAVVGILSCSMSWSGKHTVCVTYLWCCTVLHWQLLEMAQCGVIPMHHYCYTFFVFCISHQKWSYGWSGPALQPPPPASKQPHVSSVALRKAHIYPKEYCKASFWPVKAKKGACLPGTSLCHQDSTGQGASGCSPLCLVDLFPFMPLWRHPCDHSHSGVSQSYTGTMVSCHRKPFGDSIEIVQQQY